MANDTKDALKDMCFSNWFLGCLKFWKVQCTKSPDIPVIHRISHLQVSQRVLAFLRTEVWRGLQPAEATATATGQILMAFFWGSKHLRIVNLCLFYISVFSPCITTIWENVFYWVYKYLKQINSRPKNLKMEVKGIPKNGSHIVDSW